MTNEQINIAIAEVRGWTDCVFVESLKLTKGLPPPNNPPIYGAYENGMAQLPNYCNDLNVIHEAEKVLNDEQWLEYREELRNVVLGGIRMVSQWCKADLHATARQRAEAFLKTIGKWEEEQSEEFKKWFVAEGRKDLKFTKQMMEKEHAWFDVQWGWKIENDKNLVVKD
jgi:hypothetical protein